LTALPERVVGLGLCVRDEVFLVDDFAPLGDRSRYSAHVRMPGGMTAVAVAHAAALGCDAELLSMIGRDGDGRFVAKGLRECGVSMRRVIRHDDLPTTTCVVLVRRRDGERRFVVPERRAIERGAPDFDLAPIRRGAVLLIDGHFPEQALRAVRRARERGVPVVGDFARVQPSHLRLLPFVDHPIVPRAFVETLGVGNVRETLRYLRDRFGATPVVTLGREGALALLPAGYRRVPASRVDVVDTTGAGDAFHGAFAVGLVRGLDVTGALTLAARTASQSCRFLGGMGSLLG
jgi:sulfofructose kinase